jgi:hypothetical protein
MEDGIWPHALHQGENVVGKSNGGLDVWRITQIAVENEGCFGMLDGEREKIVGVNTAGNQVYFASGHHTLYLGKIGVGHDDATIKARINLALNAWLDAREKSIIYFFLWGATAFEHFCTAQRG